MAIKLALWSISGAVALAGLLSGPAFAGSPASSPCGPGLNCTTPVVVAPHMRRHADAISVENRTPYDYLDSVHFQRSPHISITRIHGLPPTVGLSDAPSGFSKGCHPESTTYCRANYGASNVTASASAPATTSALTTPTIIQTAPPRIIAQGDGYNPGRFAPRHYPHPQGFVPGIAHIPTSIVDRDPGRAQAVLDSGRAHPNPLTGPGGITPALLGVPVRPHVPPALPHPVMPYRPAHAGPVYQQPAYPRPIHPGPVHPGPVYGHPGYGHSAGFTQSRASASARSGRYGTTAQASASARSTSQSWVRSGAHSGARSGAHATVAPSVCRQAPSATAHPPHPGPCQHRR